jgi:hypothetical protein
VSKASPWTNSSTTKPVYPARGVMYDCVQLEAGALLGTVAPQFTGITVNEATLTLQGEGGIPDGICRLLVSDSVTGSVAEWMCVATNTFDGNGHFRLTNAISPAHPQRFYRLQVP